MKVYLRGAATTKFGELWNISPRTLVGNAVNDALTQSGLNSKDIQAIFVGNMLSGALGNQEHLGAFFAEELGMIVPAMRVEGACASGGLAMHAGVLAALSGSYENVLVVGVEKMTDYQPEEVASLLMGAGSEAEREAGATFPALYALIARAHMEKYGTTEEEMAAVSVKNHYHASLNSHAHFTSPVTIKKVLRSPVVASPLKLLDCSPISDGAAAVVISTVKPKSKKHVAIVASSVSTDTLGLSERHDLTTLQSAVRASSNAYEIAGIGPKDVDVAEVHDCFTIAEIIAMEDLGFFPRGIAGKSILEGETRIGKKLVVNISGGLKASGHPVGATGVKQIVETYQQLLGIAGPKQIQGARVGLTHNVGGSGATAVIHILALQS
ncbi:thiolase domain-containing protein [Candidatus Gottesmanbacteria bacterium]|nr:thiolase domain-containing protein [Candidatus Gottesmanbacteria bacterium]